MKRIAFALAAVTMLGTSTLLAQNWPHWRGPSMNGISSQTGLPVTWSKTENIAWTLPLPELGAATPIIWGNHLFLNVSERGTVSLWAVDRLKGTALWKRPLATGDRMQQKANNSTPSPVTDGRTVWVITGNGILKAFDFAGKELWTRDIQADYGRFGIQFGYRSSPLLHEGALYVPVLHGMLTDDPSYVLKIDGATGKTVWRTERPTRARAESPDSYTTPALLKVGTTTEVVITGGDVVTGHDPASGREVWRVDGLNPNDIGNYRLVASPVVHGDLIIAPSRERPMLAIKAGGRGDATASHVLWRFMSGPDVPSPVTDGTHVYSINDRGILYVLNARTGATVYGPHRLRPATYSASPVMAEGKIYVTDEDGVTTIFRTGTTFQLVAENDLTEYTLASPAIVEGQIFIRTDKNLYAIGQRRAPAPAK
jgi:outer membrane protein assembly factor BamB